MSAPRRTRRELLWATGLSSLGMTGAWLRNAEAQEAGGTLTVGLGSNPITCDPINMTSHDTQILSQTVFENLVEFDIDGVLRPQLAKALPTISDNKLVYSFELRDDVFFQNGQKLTAEDVKYSFEYMLDPINKAVRRPVFSRLSHVEIDGPYRLRVHLTEPYSPWQMFLTKFMGIWPKGSRHQLGDDAFRRQPIGVGTGPGIFEEWQPNSFVSFKRNPSYWQSGLPKWERLVVKIVPETTTRVAFLLGGQADIIGAPHPREFARLKERRGIAGDARPTLGGWTVLAMNNARPPFDDLNFRLAVAHAVDRKTITDKIYYGLIEQSGIPAPRSSWWYNEAADRSVEYNLDLAKSYLAKSKYAQGASFELLTSSDVYLLDTRDVSVFLQAELAKLNIKVDLRLAEDNVVSSTSLRGEYDAMVRHVMSPGEPTYLAMVNFMENQVMSKTSNFADPKVSEILRRAFAETEEVKLKPIYDELLTELAAKSPYVWIGFFSATNLWRDRVHGFRPSRGLTITVRDTALA